MNRPTLLLLLAGCGGEATLTDTDATQTAPADYAESGPHAANRADGVAGTPSCGMEYTRYTPQDLDPAAVVILAHGFARSRAQMDGWGQLWASWGLDVIAPDLCTNGASIDHAQNGRDLVALAAEVAPGVPPLYAGHSAGGLAAFLAAAGDAGAIGQLGLDLVDSEGLAADAASSQHAPVADIAGDASACNADNNGIAPYEAAGGEIKRVAGATHCSFEDPTDALCTVVCGEATDPAISATIRRLDTAWLLWRSGTDPAAESVWTETP